MKKFTLVFVLLVGSFFLMNCSSEDSTDLVEEVSEVIDDKNEEPGTDPDPEPDPEPGNYYKKGDFESGAHVTKGIVMVSKDKKTLTFTGFKTDPGPLLEVYLTTTAGASEYITLGALKGVEGDFTYDIPENTDLDKYIIVDIWCVEFSVSFGTAELK